MQLLGLRGAKPRKPPAGVLQELLHCFSLHHCSVQQSGNFNVEDAILQPGVNPIVGHRLNGVANRSQACGRDEPVRIEMNSNALRELLVPNVGHGAGVHPRPCSFQNSHGLLELSELQRLKSIYIVASVLNQDSTAVGEIAILRAIAWATVVA